VSGSEGRDRPIDEQTEPPLVHVPKPTSSQASSDPLLPMPPLPPSLQQVMAASSGSYDGGSEDGSWKCRACTFRNPPSQQDICSLCEATKGANFSAVQSLGATGAAEPEEDILARELQISVEEARDLLKKREWEDRKFAESISEPQIECIGCMESVPISDCFTVDCQQAHRFCFECMRRQVKIALDEKKIPTCLLCSHTLSQVEVKQLFGQDSTELTAHLDTEIGSLLASQPDLYIGKQYSYTLCALHMYTCKYVF
jgi:hypothetical protein